MKLSTFTLRQRSSFTWSGEHQSLVSPTTLFGIFHLISYEGLISPVVGLHHWWPLPCQAQLGMTLWTRKCHCPKWTGGLNKVGQVRGDSTWHPSDIHVWIDPLEPWSSALGTSSLVCPCTGHIYPKGTPNSSAQLSKLEVWLVPSLSNSSTQFGTLRRKSSFYTAAA